MIAFTPLADVWFVTISGLTRELADFALTPTRIMAVLPALSVLLSFQRAVLMGSRWTKPITTATVIEVSVIAVAFAVGGWWIGMVGATAAFLSYVWSTVEITMPQVRPAIAWSHCCGMRSVWILRHCL